MPRKLWYNNLINKSILVGVLAEDNNGVNECLKNCPSNKIPNSENVCIDCFFAIPYCEKCSNNSEC